MKFNIIDIGHEGIRFHQNLDETFVHQLLKSAGVDLARQECHATLNVELTRNEDVVFIRGKIFAEFFVACSRCLEPAKIILDESDLSLTVLPQKTEVVEVDVSLEDQDTFTHDGHQVDLEPIFREFLLLAIPITPLCHEDCKGICSKCGADLNLNPCHCDKESNGSLKWTEALKKLKPSA